MENLGFYYNWNSETGTSEISTFEYIDSLKVPEDVTGEDDQGSTDNNTSEIDNTNNENSDGIISESTDNGESSTGDESNNGSADENVDNPENSDNNSENTSDAAADVDAVTDDITDKETGSDENTEDDGEDNIEDDTEKVTLPRKLINVFNPNEGYKFFIDRDNCAQTLKLPVPNDVSSSDFEMNEELLGCLTELVLKGDYSVFYADALVDNTGEAILQIQVYYDPNTDETIFKIFSDVVLGCGLSDAEDNFVNVRMDFVKNIYKKVIVMDAGHGGHDPGAQHQGYNESDLNLKIVLNCRELFKDTDIKVYYTRIDDTFLSLYDRAAFAELVGADMFIAVHHNSSWYDTVTGTSVYWGDKDTSTSLNGLTSEKLAWRMLENLTAALDTKVFGEGAINKNFVVVRDSKAPAVLLEIGFMSNSDELSRLVKDKFSKKVARTIVDTVLDIYEEAE
jgi:N-acetylmuramoyl-L-alanine amidase